MLIEVKYSETSVDTVKEDIFCTMDSSLPRSCSSEIIQDYKTIVRTSKESLLKKIPDYLKESEKRREYHEKLKRERDANNRDVRKFITEMLQLQENKKQDDCMYRIYEQLSMWSSERRTERCDILLDIIEVDQFDIHILLSLLMATFPLRRRLSYRQIFFTKVLNCARLRYPEEKIHDLFVGLD